HRDVFVGGMRVRRHLVAGRRLDAQDERACLARITADDGKLRTLRISGWGGTPLQRVGRCAEVLVGRDGRERQRAERPGAAEESHARHGQSSLFVPNLRTNGLYPRWGAGAKDVPLSARRQADHRASWIQDRRPSDVTTGHLPQSLKYLKGARTERLTFGPGARTGHAR